MLPLDFNKIAELFTARNLVYFVLTGLINAILMILVSYKFFQAIQQCGYKGNEYFKWLSGRDNVYKTRLFMLSMLSVLGFMLTNMALSFISHPIASYAGFAVYLLFLLVYLGGEKKRKDKIPLVITRRMLRLMLTFVLLTVLLSVSLIFAVNFVAIPLKNNLLSKFRYAILCLCPVLVPYIVLLAYYVNEPFEKANNKKFVKKCTEKLESLNGVKKIGVTGSYGKTSVKEILNVFLSEKYKVLATPKSFNTPLGICKTVKRLNDDYDYFIAEMGARRNGEIKELAEIVKPDIAVITGVTAQHLETFGNIDNVIKTKYELIENMKNGGIAVFSSDCEPTKKMYSKCGKEKYLAGVCNDNSLVYAEDIKITEKGTYFTIVSGGEKSAVHTKLLGRHNVSNICLAAAVAKLCGLSLGEIAAATERLNPVKHRMELIEGENGVLTIDDSYNSNPEGSKTAVQTLSAFGGRKFVVTPGIVELGFAENEINFKLGAMLAKVADYVILVGRGRTLKIREGLIYEGFKTENVIMVKSLGEAKEELKKRVVSGDVVLFENDLPDKYN